MKVVLFATIGILLSAGQGVPAQLNVPVRSKIPVTTTTLKLRVRVIRTSYGIGGGGVGKYPKAISLRIPAMLRNSISAYGAADRIWLAPKGWTGTAAQGVDASTEVKLYPTSGYSRAGAYVIYSDSGGCAGCGILDAAPYFPVARKLAPEFGGGKETIPAGMELQHLSPHVITFSLPGTSGIMVRGAAFYSGDSDYYYAQVKFALPRSEDALLHFLLEHYLTRFRMLEHGK